MGIDVSLNAVSTALGEKGTKEEVLDILNTAIDTEKQNENLARFYYYRGYLYRTRFADCYAALKDYNKVLDFIPNDEDTLEDLIFIYDYLQDYNSLITITKKRINNNPNNEYLYYFLSTVYIKIYDFKNTILYATKSIKIKSKNPLAFQLRGLAELEIGQTEKGYQDLNYAKRQFLELNDIDRYKKTVYYENKFIEKNNENNDFNDPLIPALDNINRSIESLYLK